MAIEMYFYTSTNFTQFTRTFIFTTCIECPECATYAPVCVCVCICLRPACGPLASQTIAKHSPGAEDASPEMPERILCKLQAGGEP